MAFGLFQPKTLAQTARRPLEPPVASEPESPRHRTRLILKDGSYQTVLGYEIKGQVVIYRSAERNGEREELPLALVDLAATQAWERAHDPAQVPRENPSTPAQVLSPDLAREEALRAAQTPEVAKDLRLPEENSVLALDVFRGTSELVPLPQNGSDLNRETAHAISRKEIKPEASPHDLFLVKDERADVQLHVAEPIFYVRLLNSLDEVGAQSAFVVDTEGQAGRETPAGSSGRSTYVLERLDVRQGARAISSLHIATLGTSRQQSDAVALKAEVLAGGVWLKLTPAQPLEFGEYALVEILSDRALNADVWDFGVHPTAKENDEAIRPEPKRPVTLERRRSP